jgi:hypothetical protein
LIIYFAGVNQTHFCERFIGRHVLESFSDSRPLYGRYRAMFESMILDCGAGDKRHRQGASVKLHAYADFCLEHGDFYEWVASADDINGGASLNLNNWQFMLDRGVEAVPTFHQGEPISLLEEYCSRAGRIGLGGKDRPIRDAEAFLDAAFSVIPQRVKVHGWALTNYTAKYPFESVDSKSWNHELLALRDLKTSQRGDQLAHLTDGELIEIIQKRYDRMPRMQQWEGRRREQFGLFAKASGK